MNLYKTGYIVAIIDNDKEFSYRPWPLEEFSNDAEAEKLDNEGDDRWFMKYDMLQISPDYDYVSRYNDYCRNIGLDTCILLVESPYKYFEVEEIGNNDMVYM